jgi:hypothetical protein
MSLAQFVKLLNYSKIVFPCIPDANGEVIDESDDDVGNERGEKSLEVIK